MNLENMLKRLTSNYNKDKKSGVYKLFASIAPEIEILKNTFDRISSWQGTDNACGTTLDLIGEDVMQARRGMTDSQYRPMLKLRYAVNRSETDINSVNTFADKLLGKDFIKLEEAFVNEFYKEPAAIIFYLSNTNIDIPYASIEDIIAAGVRIIWLLYKECPEDILYLKDKETHYISRMYITGEPACGTVYQHEYTGKIFNDRLNLGTSNINRPQRIWVTNEPKSGQTTGGK